MKGLPCTIRAKSLSIPAVCPILGIPLVKVARRIVPGTPSLDRIDSSLGYTPDNVQIISFRANTLKNDATLEELRAVVAHLEALDNSRKIVQ